MLKYLTLWVARKTQAKILSQIGVSTSFYLAIWFTQFANNTGKHTCVNLEQMEQYAAIKDYIVSKTKL